MFKIGDRVKPKIQDVTHGYKYWKKIPFKSILTIRRVFEEKGTLGLYFEEITNIVSLAGIELGYIANDFEKLVSDDELAEYKEKVLLLDFSKPVKSFPKPELEPINN